MRRSSLLLLACTLLLAHSQTLRPEASIPLPNVRGRIDHMTMDPAKRLLFVAALGNNSVEVVDLAAGKVLRSLTGFHEPQGVLVHNDKLYVANGQSGRVDVIDTKTWAPLSSIDFNSDPDNLRLDARNGEIFAGYGEGGLGVIQDGARVGQAMLDAHPESFQLEKAGPRIFANVPNAGNVTVVDRRTRSVTVKWPVEAAKACFPMALDESTHRLFLGCRKPALLIVLDTETGKQLAAAPIGGDTDDLFFDAETNRVYVSCGAGSITVLDTRTYQRIESIPTAQGARTSLFSPELKRLYVAVPHRGKQEAELRVFAASR